MPRERVTRADLEEAKRELAEAQAELDAAWPPLAAALARHREAHERRDLARETLATFTAELRRSRRAA